MFSRKIHILAPGLNKGLAFGSNTLEKKLNDFTPSIRTERAKSHIKSRKVATLQFLSALSALRSAEAMGSGPRILSTATITCVRAKEQLFSSPFPSQAAHHLWGHLCINGTYAHDYPGLTVDSRIYLLNLHAAVDHLHANYNIADRLMEDGFKMRNDTAVTGLKKRFAFWSSLVLQRRTPSTVGPDRELVMNIFEREVLPDLKRTSDALATQIDETLSVTYPGYVCPQIEGHCTMEGIKNALTELDSAAGRLTQRREITHAYSSAVFSPLNPEEVRDAFSVKISLAGCG